MAAIEIRGSKVFYGTGIVDAEKIVIENGLISDRSSGDSVIDGTGCTLLPGLIDSHLHLYGRKNLEETAKYGITTAMDMGTRTPDIIDNLRNQPGLTDIRSAYNPAFAPESTLPQHMGCPASSHVTGVADVERFVNEQLAHGADYIKVILEQQSVNGGGAEFPFEILTAIIELAHHRSKRVIVHVIAPDTYRDAIEAGADVLTHIPFAIELPQPLIEKMAAKKIVSVPTMYMMKGIVETIKQRNPRAPFDYNHVRRAVAAMHASGVTLLAGTDSNMDDPTTPFSTPYGVSLLDEIALMVNAGLTPIEALQSATSVPARYWGLADRGTIKAGQRADLLLVEGDPTTNIHDLHNIKRVWIAGREIS